MAKEPDPTLSVEDVSNIIEFHGTPVAAQVLREVLGQLGRTAAAASRRQPKNRPEPFGQWNPPHLRLLAELCELYSPGLGGITSPLDQREPESFSSYDPTDAERIGMESAAAQDAEVKRIEAGLIAELAALEPAAEDTSLASVPYQPSDAGIPGTVDHSAAALDEQKAAAMDAEVKRIEAELIAQRDAKRAELAALEQPTPDPFHAPDPVPAEIVPGVYAPDPEPSPF